MRFNNKANTVNHREQIENCRLYVFVKAKRKQKVEAQNGHQVVDKLRNSYET